MEAEKDEDRRVCEVEVVIYVSRTLL
jgi:hypothetical protein